ncbi:MAG: VOC family protein [Ectothiorhodospiraceae bacterium]|nr:VOC family protein [Ectothiorhodospiraceae bacterium]
MPEVIGIDHIFITVSNIERSKIFYDSVMETLGFRNNLITINNEEHVQYYNKHFGYVLRPAHVTEKHNAYAPSLHHLCLRVESENDIDEIAKMIKNKGIEVTEPKFYKEYAPDYYAIFLKDPDDVELEITNYRKERKQRYENWEMS